MYKVLISDQLHPEALAWLEEQQDIELLNRPETERAELQQLIAEVEALIVRSRTRVDAELIGQAKRLRVIGRAGTGLDNIDLVAAGRAGIVVLNTPGVNANAVAELTLGLMIALARRLPEAFGARTKLKRYGWELRGKRLGIVGLGQIGSRVAQLAAAFGMEILACEIDPKAGPKGLEIERVQLERLLGESDIVSLHVPLTEETRCMVDEEALRWAKEGVAIINTARAEVVDEAALLAALDAGRVSGYAADLWKDERLASHPRVIPTPHIGAQTAEAQRRAGVEIAKQVVAALRSSLKYARSTGGTDSG
jgi:D-3-phosphoglycerate dehydrogenase